MSAILAASRWNTNAELIRDVATLGYIKKTDRVCDPTYGRGNWWALFRPDYLVATDSHKLKPAVDFRKLPWTSDRFDVVAFDPPYVAKGGRTTSGIQDFDDRFGLKNAPDTPEGVQQMMNDGMTECVRVLRPQGFLLVKCQNYISSGRFWAGVHRTWSHAVHNLELLQADEFVMHGPEGVQPPGRRQVHARNNYSVLFVFKKPNTRRTSANAGIHKDEGRT